MAEFDPARVAALDRADFEAAAATIASLALRTPLLPYFGKTNGATVFLKPENLQPFGSFKLRGATCALAAAGSTRVATASAGNFGQGLAFAARSSGTALTVHVPDSAAAVKLAALRALGAAVVVHDFPTWWHIMESRDTGSDDGVFIHPVCETSVIAGNGTIGLELAWAGAGADIDTVVVPVGGGGLICGIALALRAAGRGLRIVAAEVETSTPLASAFANGEPVTVERRPSFVDGIGSTRVLDPMWPLLRDLVDEVSVVTLAETRDALRSAMADNHLVLEGAGAAALAAARKRGAGQCCAILSGGNIDPAVFAAELLP